MEDNFKAGEAIDIAVEVPNAKKGAYTTTQAVRYCDIFGGADLLQVLAFKNEKKWTIEESRRLPYDTVQDMLNGLNANKVDKVQVEAGKLLLSNGTGRIEASTIGIQEYEDKKEYIDQLHSEQEQRMDRIQEEITANTEDRHIHTNKEILDGYTVANNVLLESVDKKCTRIEIWSF